jgi:hypothetical protein
MRQSNTAEQHNITTEPQRAQRKDFSFVPKTFGTNENMLSEKFQKEIVQNEHK